MDVFIHLLRVGTAAATAILLTAISTIAAENLCWIDAATGKRVVTLPQSLTREQFSLSRGQTQVSGSGHNYVSLDGGQTWINSLTGKPVATLPQGLTRDVFSLSRGEKQVSGSGHNYVRVPCGEPDQHSHVMISPRVTFGFGMGNTDDDNGDDRKRPTITFGF